MKFESFCLTYLLSFKHFYLFFLLCDYLTISVPVTSVILTPTPIIALAGQQINITCTTSYCYPPAYVMWYMSSTDITSLSIATKDETEDFVRTVSFLSINLGKSDNGKHVFCIARNIRDQSETSMMNTVTVLCMYPLMILIQHLTQNVKE